ncbi:Gti1/Pac2 family-domain-containing protein [Cladochytrium replicatum]|nr:Gti1/Pac2 family-domain-containing protein [Cladochytrium replicatum]
MSSTPLPIGSIETFFGLIETTHDAFIVFESCRLGLLQRVGRRLHEAERKEVRSGSVFVYNEKESSIKRWTDGRLWSPSRILGNFLVYKELDKKIQKKGQRYIRDGKNLVEVDGKRAATGSKGTYLFKEAGLIKKTITASINGQQFHLVSYYTKTDIQMGRLKSPRSNAILADVVVPDDLLHEQNFRKPPSSKPPPLVATQQLLRRARNIVISQAESDDGFDDEDQNGESESSSGDGSEDELSDKDNDKRNQPSSEPFDLFPLPSPIYPGIHTPHGTLVGQTSTDPQDLAMFRMDQSQNGEPVAALFDYDEVYQSELESFGLHFDPSFPTDTLRSSSHHFRSFPHGDPVIYSSSAPSSSVADRSRGSPISRSRKRTQARDMLSYKRFPEQRRLHHREEKFHRLSASAPTFTTATRSSFPILTRLPQQYVNQGSRSSFQFPSALGFPSFGSRTAQHRLTTPVFVRADGGQIYSTSSNQLLQQRLFSRSFYPESLFDENNEGGMAHQSVEAISNPFPQTGYNPPDLTAAQPFLRLTSTGSELTQSFPYIRKTSANCTMTQSFDSGASEIPEFILAQCQQSLYSPDSVVSTGTSSSVGSFPFFESTAGLPPATSTGPLSHVFGSVQGDVLKAPQSAPDAEKLDGMLFWPFGDPSNAKNLFLTQTDVAADCARTMTLRKLTDHPADH